MEMRPGYKQTEVGIIPEDWEVSDLEATARVIDSLHRTPQFSDDGYPMVRVTDIKTGDLSLSETFKVSKAVYQEFVRNYEPKRGDIVLSRVGSYGVSSFVETNEPFCMGQNTVVLHPKLPARFLYYALNSRGIRQQIEDGSYGSGYKSLSLRNIKELRIPLPSTEPEQRAIAAALSDVDALLDGLHRLIAKKRDLKQAAMQQLLTGQTRLPGFSGAWEVKRLGEVADVLKGSALSKSLIAASGAHPCILYGELFTTYGRVISNVVSRTNSSEGCRSVAGDVLLPGSTTTTGADLATASALLIEDVALGGDIIIVRRKGKSYDPVFLASFLTHTARHEIAELTQGITIHHLYGKDLKTLALQLPSLPEQTAIAAVLSDMDAELAALEARRDKTRDLKQAMMQELLTGKTRLVPNGDSHA